MSASRLPLLGAFAGGCLSAALLFGLWAGTQKDSAAHKPVARSSALVAASIVDPQSAIAGQRRRAEAEAPREPSATAQAEPPIAEAAKQGPDVSDAPPAKDTQDVASAPPNGSAVSDILTDLEAAYRQRLIAAARAERAEAEAALERAPTPVAAKPAPAPVEPPAQVATRAVVPVSPVSAAPAEPVPNEPPAAPAPALVAAQNDARPPDIHIGDVNQNTYITNVRQGDVYVTQQLAMLQYMQLLGASAGAGLPQAGHVPRGTVQRSTPQFKQFPSTLTNLDNPWGFNFAPPNLVH